MLRAKGLVEIILKLAATTNINRCAMERPAYSKAYIY